LGENIRKARSLAAPSSNALANLSASWGVISISVTTLSPLDIVNLGLMTGSISSVCVDVKSMVKAEADT